MKILDDDIYNCKKLIQLEKDVKELIEKYKHNKEIDNTFFDDLEAMGYQSYVKKYELFFIYPFNSGVTFPSFYVNFQGKELTYDLIENEFKNRNYENYLNLLIESKECFESEKKIVKEFYDKIRNTRLRNFSLCSIERALRKILMLDEY